jgi:hypothetical protein
MASPRRTTGRTTEQRRTRCLVAGSVRKGKRPASASSALTGPLVHTQELGSVCLSSACEFRPKGNRGKRKSGKHPPTSDCPSLGRLFRKARPAHSSGPIGVIAGSPDRRSGGSDPAGYPVAIARLCCQSLRSLWVAVISRHSARQAQRPRRWNLSIRRLCLVCANTGSMIAWRCRCTLCLRRWLTVRASRDSAFVVGESTRVSSGSRRRD